MASVIKLKRSSSAGAVPAGSDLEVGEVAINLADRVIYSKQAGGAVVRIGEAALANTNAAIASVQSALDTQEAKQASNLANTNAFIASVQSSAGGGLGNTNLAIAQLNTNLTATNTAIRSLITSNDTDIATQTARVDLVNTNLTATNTAIRALTTTNASDIATQAARVDLVNTNLTATNTAIRLLNTNTQSALDTQEAKQASDLANTNAFITSVQNSISSGAALANTNLAIAQLNTNLTATNTAIRLLNTNTQSALDTQEAKQASNLANTNAYIAATQGNLDTQIASERAALANTNTRISNLSTTLSGDFLTKANPESSGLLAHTGRATISTNLSVAGNTHIDGNLTVEGEVTYISTTTLEVMDPLIKLASNNQTDAVDTGFYALYDEGSTAKYAGIFRDATDGVFKVFKDLQADPTVTVDTSGTGYAIGQLDAIVDGGSF
jgi:hypothetical protein